MNMLGRSDQYWGADIRWTMLMFPDVLAGVKSDKVRLVWCHNYDIPYPVTLKAITEVFAAVEGSNTLALLLCNLRLERGSAEVISELLRNDKQLEALFLVDCGLGDEVMETMADLVANNETLQIFSLRENNLRNLGTLPQALMRNSTLKRLFLSVNPLSSESVAALCRTLTVHTSIHHLSLHSCELGNEAARSLANVLRHNNTLRVLEVQENQIRDDGIVELAQAAEVNTGLEALDVSTNFIEPDGDGLGALIRLIETTKNLKAIGVNGVYMDAIEGLGFVEAVEQNEVIEHLGISRAGEVINTRKDAILQARKTAKTTRLLDALTKAGGSSAKSPWLRSKLMVVGEGGVGKTNTVRALMGLSFREEWDSTIGVGITEVSTGTAKKWVKAPKDAFAARLVRRLAKEEANKRPENDEEKSKKPPQKVNETNVATAPSKTEEKIQKNEVENNSSTKVKESQAVKQYRKWLVKPEHNERNEDDIRMSVWDYGGQTVFYTLHHLFLTRYGLYLVVFNMSQFLEAPDEALPYIAFWLNSIKLHAPSAPVLIVGTFLDMIKDPIQDLESIESQLKVITKDFKQVKRSRDFSFFSISTNSGWEERGVANLRSTIENETNSCDFVRTMVSISWMRCLDLLEKSSKRPYRYVSALRDGMKDRGVEREEEVESMLRLFHELGVVLYFSTSERLKKMVITKPEWLLKQVGLIIRDKDLHEFDLDKINEVQLTQDLEDLLKLGIVTRDLLEFLWAREEVDYLLELMKHLLLLGDWSFTREESYLVPSMVQAVTKEVKRSGSEFYLQFEFLPIGVFERIACLCVTYSCNLDNVSEPKFWKSFCEVDLSDRGYLQIDATSDNRVALSVSKEEHASAAVKLIISMMRRIQQEFMHGALSWETWVSDGDHYVKYAVAKQKKLHPWVAETKARKSLRIDTFLGF